jgi:hypothetical protein
MKNDKMASSDKETSPLQALLDPWFQSIANPRQTQEEILARLLKGYAQTQYGRDFQADKISSITEFQRAFPVVTYADLRPHIDKVIAGDFSAFLPEPPVEWGLSRGTTRGESKLVPMTASDLTDKTKCGARGLLNYVQRKQRFDILAGWDLNIGFPSRVRSMRVGDKEVFCGYTSGIYTKYNARNARLQLVPDQDEIDALGGGIAKDDWERRFELIYEKARDKKVSMVIGVTPVIIEFGSYLKKKHRLYPKDVWNVSLIAATSVSDIQTKYRPALRGLYGDVAVVEMYGGTEGMYGQQLDDQPFITPNYDTYLFEVQTGRGTKPLCDLKPKEYGSLIFSSVVLPRYRMGDIISCTKPNYFRVIGREGRNTVLRHRLGRLWES